MANKIIITGHIGQDAEKINTSNGFSYFRFSVATNETWKDKNSGEKKSQTTWHNCMLYGNYDNLAPYLRKGTCVTLSGTQRNDQIEYKKNGQPVTLDGQNIKTTYSFIKVKDIELVGGGGNQGNQNQQNQNTQPAQASTAQASASVNSAPSTETDDLPF